jgi:hypothetical protein
VRMRFDDAYWRWQEKRRCRGWRRGACMTTTTTTTTTMAMMVRILRVDVGDGVVIELMVLSSPMVVLVMWLAALLKQHCLLNTIFIRAFNVLSSLWVSPLSLSLSLSFCVHSYKCSVYGVCVPLSPLLAIMWHLSYRIEVLVPFKLCSKASKRARKYTILQGLAAVMPSSTDLRQQ